MIKMNLSKTLRYIMEHTDECKEFALQNMTYRRDIYILALYCEYLKKVDSR